MKRTLITLAWLLMLWSGMYAQKTIQGVVVDESGQPVPGASVLISGTNQGTITDTDGNFILENIASTTELEVSFLGMVTEVVEVGEQTHLEIQLIPDLMQLDELVVIGYGTVKRKDLTGAVASVKSEDISMSPTTNTIEALQGRVAGLDITRNSGSASSGMSILLRGNRTFGVDNEGNEKTCEPIYIIDGIQGSISNLNPNDIVSIDILKDASSTAIYGYKGANGVVMITTRQAEKGKMQVDFNSYVSINSNPSFPSALQGDAWLDYLEEGYRATNGESSPDRETLLMAWGLSSTYGELIDEGKWVDWVDESLETGLQYNTDLSIRAGNERVQSSFSLGYAKTEGIYQNDYQDKLTLRENMNIEVCNWMKAGIVTGLVYQNRESRSSRINKAFGMSPLGEAYNSDGEINVYPVDTAAGEISILVDNIDGTYRNNKKSININANPYIEITPIKGLSYKSTLGTSLSSNRQGIYNSDHTYMMLVGSSTAISNATYATSFSYSYTWENVINYKITLAADHNLEATAITSYSDGYYETSSSYSEELYEDYLFYNLDAGSNQSVSTYYEESSSMSYAGRLNYNYKGKYFITGSVRYDGVSKLKDKWDIFPAGAVAWRISDEDFMASTKNWLNNLKLRVGYGVAGSDNINPYQTEAGVTNGADDLNLGSGQIVTTVPTTETSSLYVGWEKTYSLNVGIDFGLFKGRIDGSLEWYNQDSEEIIYTIELPSTSGGSTPKILYTLSDNLVGMNNKGVELTLNTRNIQTHDFQWTSTFTFAWNREELSYLNLGSGITADELISEGIFVGEPRYVYYGYKKLGIWQSDEADDAAVFGLEPGDVKVASNLTKISDGVWQGTVEASDGSDSTVTYTADNPYTINADDRQILGHKNPDWTAGFQNTFTYKGFDLTIFITSRWGHMIQGDLLGYFSYGSLNLPDNYDYWTEDNATDDYPRPYLSSRSTAYSDPLGGDALSYVDGSYIKVKNITLGYTLPKSLLAKAKITNLRMYGTVYNSFIYTKSHLLKGLDPETGASDSFPLYKQLVFGLNVSF